VLCSGRYAAAQRAGDCVAAGFVLVDGFGNERCFLSPVSRFLMHLPVFRLPRGLSPALSAGEGCRDPSGRGEGSAAGTRRCVGAAGSRSILALQWE